MALPKWDGSSWSRVLEVPPEVGTDPLVVGLGGGLGRLGKGPGCVW